MDVITKIVKSLEETGLLIKVVSKTIKTKQKNKKAAFLTGVSQQGYHNKYYRIQAYDSIMCG